MVNAVVPAAAVPVENGGEVWKIAVEVNILGVGTSIGPTIQQVALKHIQVQTTRRITRCQSVTLFSVMMVKRR